MNDSNTTPDTLERLVTRCLDAARSRGADAAEAGASYNEGLSVGIRLGEVETVEYQRDRSIGVSVYFGQRKGTATTADFSAAALEETVAAACRIAEFTTEDPCVGLADPSLYAREFPDLDLDHPWGIEPGSAIELAIEVESAARAEDPRIVNSEGAGFDSERGMRCYGNTAGFIGHSQGTHHGLSCVVIAGADGQMQRDWWQSVGRAAGDLDPPESVGVTAARRALRRLGSRRLRTARVPVLFAPEVSRGLMSHLLAAIRGGAQYRRASFLLDGLGSRVFPDFVTVREDPLRVHGPASAAFDAEGVATRARDIVRAGVLETYLLDSYSARRLGRETTGHAGGWTNIDVAGTGDAGDLMQRMGRGLLVTELMGQGVNLVTGDYSRGAAGFWVEDGAVAYPVEEFTVAGNLRDMFLGTVAIGADADRRHALQVGSLLVGEMAVGGE